jgi:comEA protein
MTRLKTFAATLAALGLLVAMLATPALAQAKAAPAAKVNLNTASAQQLATLPGVGPKLADRIVEYRQKSGGFRSVEELMNVGGVGEKNFAKLQAHVVLGDKPAASAAVKAPAAQ